jgi:hypothetical protein
MVLLVRINLQFPGIVATVQGMAATARRSARA